MFGSLQALEYAKVQVLRQPAQKGSKDRVDPTEEYVNSLFPANDDDEDEQDDRRCKWKSRRDMSFDWGFPSLVQGQRRKTRPDQQASEGDDDEDDDDNQ